MRSTLLRKPNPTKQPNISESYQTTLGIHTCIRSTLLRKTSLTKEPNVRKRYDAAPQYSRST
jgi:hypothetical protein